MGQEIFQVDAFTDRPFAGNPAAVCVLSAPRDDEWMQHVAREMNVSETAFLLRQADGFDLRWFTPAIEVDLCGHATLASAHVLWQEEHLAPTEKARFHTRSGLLEAKHRNGWIELDFPAYFPQPSTVSQALVEALGVTPGAVANFSIGYLVAELESEGTVRGLAPDFARLATPAGHVDSGHEPGRNSGVRLRLAGVFSPLRHPGGSGHRIDALLSRTVLARASRPGLFHRLAGVRTRRCGPRSHRRGPGVPGRPGGHGPQRGARLKPAQPTAVAAQLGQDRLRRARAASLLARARFMVPSLSGPRGDSRPPPGIRSTRGAAAARCSYARRAGTGGRRRSRVAD